MQSLCQDNKCFSINAMEKSSAAKPDTSAQILSHCYKLCQVFAGIVGATRDGIQRALLSATPKTAPASLPALQPRLV
jgi:hypothetical protein